MIKTFTVVFLLQLILSFSAQANQCFTTADLVEINPMKNEEFLVPQGEERAFYWNDEVKKAFKIRYVKLPDSDTLYFNMLYCQDGSKRPSIDSINDFPEGACKEIGKLYFPVDSFEPSESMTGFYRQQIAQHLTEVADEYAWSPYIKTSLTAVKEGYIALLGISILRKSYRYKPTTRKGKVGRFGGKLFGFFTLGLYAWSLSDSSVDDFSGENNLIPVQLNDLVSQINSQRTLRFDGQDRDQVIELDTFEIVRKAFEAASQKTFDKYCKG